nr:aldehyde ferredoxin oxidoreductase N-terminal domain-containing protein [Methanosarcina barkeri]
MPAEHLWGMNIRECTEALEDKGSVACIGRAGEKQVLISSFVVDSIHSGRGGLGAVAGSKMFKAVVVKGEKELSPSAPERFRELEVKLSKLFDASPVLSKGLANYGTSVLVKLLDYMNLIPSRNFTGKRLFLQIYFQESVSNPLSSLKMRVVLAVLWVVKKELKEQADV